MNKHGKKYVDAAKLIDADKFYSPKEAVELVKKTAVTKFDSSVDVSFRLGINPKYADQQVRGAMVLTHGTGKSKRSWYLPKALKRKKQKPLVLITLAVRNSLTRFRAAGWTSKSA